MTTYNWMKNNPDKAKALYRSWYDKNKAKSLDNAKQWREKQKETGKVKYSPEGQMLSRARQRAKRDNLPFDLDIDYIRSIWVDTCPVLGIKLEVSKNGWSSNNSPSLDKVVPSKGYVKGHVNIISWRANRIKFDATVEELQLIVEYTLQHTTHS